MWHETKKKEFALTPAVPWSMGGGWLARGSTTTNHELPPHAYRRAVYASVLIVTACAHFASAAGSSNLQSAPCVGSAKPGSLSELPKSLDPTFTKKETSEAAAYVRAADASAAVPYFFRPFPRAGFKRLISRSFARSAPAFRSARPTASRSSTCNVWRWRWRRRIAQRNDCRMENL